MTDYDELVKALRHCSEDDDACATCQRWIAHDEWGIKCKGRLISDAAAAIEALMDAEKTYLAELAQCHENLRRAAETRRERDERIEALQAQLPKRGEWVEDTTTYTGPGLSNYKCSLCGKIGGTWRRGLKQDELPNFCGNCGADMRAKMEVQNG